MNKLLIVFLLMYSTFSFGQKDSTFELVKSYKKGANLIVLTTPDSIDEAFKKIATILMDYGLDIEKSDKDLYFMNTEFKSLNNYSFQTKIYVRLKSDNNLTKIIIKGEALNGNIIFKPANNYKRGQVTSVCFAQLFEVAKNYLNGTIIAENE